MPPTRLSGLDSAMLSAESPVNHMHMMAVMLLDPSSIPGGYSFEKVRDFIGSRLQIVPPLRRRLVEVPFGLERPVWIEDSSIEIDWHIRRAAVPSPGGPHELAAMAAQMNSHQLDRSRPLWEILVVEGCEDGAIALLAKLHHSLMDGMAGMQFMAGLVSGEPEAKAPPPRKRRVARPPPSSLELLAGAIPGLVSKPLQLARVGQEILRATLEGALQPKREDLPEPVPTTHSALLNQPISSARSAAYTSLPLDRVKAVGTAFGATVNEVVLAIVGGALREFLRGQGEPIDEPLVAGIPVSTHDEGGDDLTNSYAVIFGSLGTHIEDPVERLNAICESSRSEKKRERAFWGEALAEITELPPPALFSLLAKASAGLKLTSRMSPFCNLVVSNVPGPPTDIYFAGARILDIYALGPIYDGLTLNITLISVTGSLDVGLSGCRQAIPDLWALADGLMKALEGLESQQPRSEATEPANLHVAEFGTGAKRAGE